MILLDTDVLIEIIQKRSKLGKEIYEKILESGEDVVTSSINIHEFLYGLKKIGKEIEVNLPTFNFTKEDAELSSFLEVELEKKGIKVGRFDCMIAAVAIRRNCSLATLNKKEFYKFREFSLKIFE